MDKITFNLDKLKKLNVVDVESGIRYCGSNQAYFRELDRFISDTGRYLHSYTPSVVVYSEEVKKNFTDEIKSIREKMIVLGMISATSSLYDLGRYIEDKNVKALSDGLLVFYSELDILALKLSSTKEAL